MKEVAWEPLKQLKDKAVTKTANVTGHMETACSDLGTEVTKKAGVTGRRGTILVHR